MAIPFRSNAISGSLTHLVDGTSYLVEGANITITSQSNGQVSIASSGGGGSVAGSDRQIQFNDGGAFGASANLVFDSNNSLGVTGSAKFSFDADSFATITVDDGGGTVIATSEAGNLVLNSEDIALVADGGQVFFQNPSGSNRFIVDVLASTTFLTNIQDADLVFRVGTTQSEVFRIDQSEDSVLMATDSKIQFRDTATSIGSTAANTLQVVAPNFGLTGSFHISSSVESDANPLLRVDHENASNILFVTGSGRVGIGTNDPLTDLDVKDDTDATARIGRANIGAVTSGVSDYAYFSHRDKASVNDYALQQRSDGTTILNTPNGGNLSLRVGNTSTALVVAGASNNNIGINMGTPLARLHVSASTVEKDIFRVDGDQESQHFALFVSGTGNVGVGTGLPTHTLHVSSSVPGADTDLFIIQGANNNDPAFEVKDVSGLNYVGINTPAGTYPLSVNLGGGNARFVNGNILFSQNNLGLRLGTIGSANSTFQSITAISSSVKTDSGILIQAGKSGADEGHGVIVSGSSESRTFRIKSHATDNIMFADGDGLVMFNSGTNSPAATSPDEQEYADINFFVSGSVGSKGSGGSSAVKGTALFGGDLVVSGTLHGGSPLKIGDITQFTVQNVDLGTGTTSTITPAAPLIFLDADSVGESGGFHGITMSTSGATIGDVVRFVVTTDIANPLVFTTGILSDATKIFNIQPAASGGGKGASFTLVYAGSSWAVLGDNGLTSF